MENESRNNNEPPPAEGTAAAAGAEHGSSAEDAVLDETPKAESELVMEKTIAASAVPSDVITASAQLVRVREQVQSESEPKPKPALQVATEFPATTIEEPSLPAAAAAAGEPPLAKAAAQERQDALAKQRARGTSRMTNTGSTTTMPGAVLVEPPTAQGLPVDTAPSVLSQQESDRMAKNRARGTSRTTSAAMPGATAVVPSMDGPPPAETAQQTGSPQQSDLMAKNRARGSARGSRATQPGATAVTPSGPPADPVENVVARQESDAFLKARARGSGPANGVVPGATAEQPSQPEAASFLSGASQNVEDAASKARAARSSRRSQQPSQTERDATAKSRARRSAAGDGVPPVVPGTATAGPSAEMESVDAPKAGTLDELARADRRVGVGAHSQSVASGESTAESRTSAGGSTVPSSDASTAGSNVASRPSGSVFSQMSEGERQRRYDAKMTELDQQHEENRENRGFGDPTLTSTGPGSNASVVTSATPPTVGSESGSASVFSNMSEADRQRRFDAKMGQMEQQHEGTRRPPTGLESNVLSDKSEDFRAEQALGMDPGITATAGRGTAVAPDVEYGEYTQPVVDDNDLVVAIAIDEEEEDEKFYAYAVEYDPESKPPIYKNRRFRLYGIGGAVCFVVLVIVLVAGIVSSKKNGGTVVLTLAPTAAPTASPTTARESVYTNYFAQAVGPKVMEPGTPHYSAAQWIMNEDPMQMGSNNPNLLQRYMMAFLWFHTTDNGATKWRSCNPPKKNESDTCEYLEFNRLANDTIVYVPRSGGVRWLSGQAECDWVNVECAGGSVVLGISICECFGSF